ncbi:ead/Ea22-like family protein [Klebsiella quasipneumoniae]|uniref:ead/Ea22-like family protein n=1 Tax=Klebsiella quasipneumoniae TaxID=1463165 RepID=UPI00265C5375|nr:ead/Ea22-like family protein [Klebsiella quasipneumoniae]MDO0743832.1 ead/Ea22-like family protein [Klebsiella quasipneumoniae]
MTTDITELAQSLKAAAEKATQGNWRAFKYHDGRCGIGGGHHDEIMVCEHISKRRPHDAEFIAMANPANILALVEALEEAQQRIAELEEAEQKLCAANVTLDARAELAERQLAEMESRTVKSPAELYTIGELIRTQDNRITDQPMFVVFQKREIIGSDEHSPSRICWVWDGEEVSELRAKRLEALYQDGRDTRGYDRYAMQEVDEFVTACFTEHGCKDYLRQNGHNLRLPYIYACGSFRNNEYQLVRNWLAGIKVEVE